MVYSVQARDFLPPFIITEGNEDQSMSQLPFEIWELILKALEWTAPLRGVALFACTCKTAFNFVYFQSSIRHHLLLSHSLFNLGAGRLSGDGFNPSHERKLSNFFPLRLLFQDSYQRLYFIEDTEFLASLIVYDQITRVVQTHRLTTITDFNLQFLDYFLKKDEVILLTKSGWLRFSSTEMEVKCLGFFSPLSESHLSDNSREIIGGVLQDDDQFAVKIRKEKSSVDKAHIFKYVFDIKKMKAGLSEEGRMKEALSKKDTFFIPKNPNRSRVANARWSALVVDRKILTVRNDCTPKILNDIALYEAISHPVLRLTGDFLFVFQRPTDLPTRQPYVEDDIECWMYYLPTGECVLCESFGLFDLPEKHEIFEIALKQEEKKMPTLVYMTQECHMTHESQWGSHDYSIKEVKFAPFFSLEEDSSASSSSESDEENDLPLSHSTDDEIQSLENLLLTQLAHDPYSSESMSPSDIEVLSDLSDSFSDKDKAF